MPKKWSYGNLLHVQCIIHRGRHGEIQQLTSTWEGAMPDAPVRFRFAVEGEHLLYQVWRAAPARLHPHAEPGSFCEGLWRFDAGEFFIATAAADRYLEFNLCANGAWWAGAFSEPRVPLAGFDAVAELHPLTQGTLSATAWQCEARLSLKELRKWGWELSSCRLAACAALRCGEQISYLSTIEPRTGRPNFHCPWDWEKPLMG